jgi:hypothetical protein
VEHEGAPAQLGVEDDVFAQLVELLFGEHDRANRKAYKGISSVLEPQRIEAHGGSKRVAPPSHAIGLMSQHVVYRTYSLRASTLLFRVAEVSRRYG